MKLQDLEKKYKSKSVESIVKEITKFYKHVHNNSKELIERLYYLERSRLFRKYKNYEKQEFKVFVWEVCHIPYNRYRQLWNAFQFFPNESEKYGPHIVQTVRQRVGPRKMERVFQEIGKETKASGKMPSREKLNTILSRYEPPKKESPVDTKSYWRDRAMKAEEELTVANKRIKELDEQIERQRPFVEAYLAIQASMQDVARMAV